MIRFVIKCHTKLFILLNIKNISRIRIRPFWVHLDPDPDFKNQIRGSGYGSGKKLTRSATLVLGHLFHPSLLKKRTSGQNIFKIRGKLKSIHILIKTFISVKVLWYPLEARVSIAKVSNKIGRKIFTEYRIKISNYINKNHCA